MVLGAVESQIQAYQQVALSLAHVQTTLQNVKNKAAATWSGDADTLVQQSFQDSINHTVVIHKTITTSIILPLQSAKAEFVTATASVLNKKPVPSTSAIEGGWDFVTGQATPSQFPAGCGVLGDVGQPQSVDGVDVELAVHPVLLGGHADQILPALAPVDSLRPGLPYQPRDLQP